MNNYIADLHIHTVLSPCGDLSMSPVNIIEAACKKGLDIIGICDHNSTRQAPLIQQLGEAKGVFVLCGAEVTSKEEVHCLAFFSDLAALTSFQNYLDQHLPAIKNNTDKFGFQVCVDKNDNIVFEEERLLISAINQSIEQIEQKVHQLGGLFIPAHINKPMFSLSSQLGFVPPNLKYDALELSKHTTVANYISKKSYLKDATFIQSSDAHIVDDIGSISTAFCMAHRSFSEIKMALHSIEGRKIIYDK